MRTAPRLAMAAAAVLAASLWAVTSDGATHEQRSSTHSNKTSSAKPEMYAVVKIGEEIKVVKKSEVAGLRKTIAEDHKRDMKAYLAAKKEAGKNKEKSDLPRPVLQKMTILKNAFKTEQEANTWADNYMQKRKDEPKTAKKAGNW